MATAKQIAARKLFAARVKAGEFKRKKNPIAKEKLTSRAYVLRPSQATKTPPSKRLITRRTKALKAPKGYFPNPDKLYWCVDKSSNGSDWSRVGYFENKIDAEQYARAYSDAHYNKMRVYKGNAHRMP